MKDDRIIYRTAKVVRIFHDQPHVYWVLIKDIGTRPMVVAGSESRPKLGSDIQVRWFPKGRCWIKK